MRSLSSKKTLPHSPFVNAKWIWPDSHSWDLHNSYALFRKKFEFGKVPSRAPLFITADQSYQLFLNGKFVGRGPARGFQSHWPFDEIDVRAYLKKGLNTIAIRAYNPGFSNFQYLTQGYAGLLVAARWGKVEIHSNDTWKSIRQASVDADTVPVSLQLFSQEHIDLRKEIGDWIVSDYDDSQWIAPAQAAWNTAPWFTLEPRNTPMLTEREIEPAALIGINEGTSAKGYEHVRDVVGLRYREDRSHRPASSEFRPLAVAATGKGRFRSYLFDFGKTTVGNLILEIQGAGGGEIIDTYHTETTELATLTPDLVIPVHCRTAFGDRLICRPGHLSHRFYHFYGFRYLCVTVRDARSDFQLGLKLSWLGYPLERKGAFQSSDADLDRIWESCAWTQQCCSLDAYVDTPWREQAQWWGDARVQAWNTFHLSGDTRLFRRGIGQIAAQTTPDGVTYGHAPTMAHGCILPDFTLIWMLTLWDYYWQTGSTEPLRTHHATIQNALKYFREHTDPCLGLVTYDDRFWLFLDWCDLFKDGASTVYNLWLLIALDKLALLYRAAKLPEEASPLEAWAKKLRVALRRLINQDGFMRDGIDRKGKIVGTTSIHSQTLALMANLEGLESEAAIQTIFLPYLRGEIQPKIVPSSYWITYIFAAVIERGYGQLVVDFIKNHWLAMAEHGTTWETFDARRGDASFSHAWSAHPLYHLMQTVGGITQTGVGWSKITFRPVFHGSFGATVIPSPLGLIRAEWKKVKNKVEVKLRIPDGVNVRVELPGRPAAKVRKGGKWSVALPEPGQGRVPK
jgi:alpha-L-rhamnosidase